MRLVPMSQMRFAAIRIDQTGHAAVRFAGEHRFDVTVEIVHLTHASSSGWLLAFILQPSSPSPAKTYPIDEADFVERYPVGHQLIAQRCYRAGVAEHKLFGRHPDDGLAARLPYHHIDRRSEEERSAGCNLSDTLRQKACVYD